MADIAIQEDERIRCGSHDCGDVGCGVARDIENVEAAITEVIVGLESSDCQLIGESDLCDRSPLEDSFVEGGVIDGRLAGYESLNFVATVMPIDLDNVAGSPQWSKCQWLGMKASTSFMSMLPSARISMVSFSNLLPWTWGSRTWTAEGEWLYQSFLDPRSKNDSFSS
jgi:hypothetical protein